MPRTDNEQSIDSLLRDVHFAVGCLFRYVPLPIAALAPMYVLWGVAPVAGIRAIQHLFNTALSLGRTPRMLALLHVLPWLGVFTVSLLLGDEVLYNVKEAVEHRIRAVLQMHLNELRLAQVAQIPLSDMETPNFANLLRNSEQPGGFVFRVAEGLLELIQGCASAVAIAALFAPVAWWISAALISSLVPQALVAMGTTERWLAFTYGQTEGERVADYFHRLLTEREAQEEIRAYGLRPWLGGKWLLQRRTVRRKRLQERTHLTMRGIPTEVATGVFMLITGVALSVKLAAHSLTVGFFTGFVGGIASFEAARTAIMNGLWDLQRSLPSVAAFRQLTERSTPSISPATSSCTSGGNGLVCEDVWYAYPGQSEPVLRGIHLTIRPGERVVLVGANGSGKSTLVKLITGLYTPQRGHIRINGVDVRDIPEPDLHALIAAVFQEFACWELTAREAISLGSDKLAYGQGDVVDPETETAARLSGADEVIARLPQRYDQPVGRVLDGAVELSRGEWQRLALARALLRQPALLILDEPTAALDPNAEAHVYRSVCEAFATRGGAHIERSLLMITHRLGPARLADRVLVLQNGRIVEEGTHDALVASGGVYASFWAAQRRWYM